MENLTKQQKQEIKRNLEAIEDVLNDYEQYEIENGDAYNYNLTLLHKNILLFKIGAEGEEFENYVIELEDADIKGICKTIIRFLYQTEINYRLDCVKDSKNYNNRKIKSLCLWNKREKTNKVEQINRDLIEHYQKIKQYQNEISIYKRYVSDLYKALWTLVPNFKVDDVSNYVVDRLNKLNINYETIAAGENKIIINGDIEIEVNSYARKEEIFNMIRTRLTL